MFFESVAFAMGAAPEGGAEGGQGGFLMSILPLVLMIGVFYLLLIRPQQKKAKEHRAMLEALRKGDKVWTNGGIKGEIVDMDGDELTVQIADNVNIVVNRGYIATLATKPVSNKSEK